MPEGPMGVMVIPIYNQLVILKEISVAWREHVIVIDFLTFIDFTLALAFPLTHKNTVLTHMHTHTQSCITHAHIGT